MRCRNVPGVAALTLGHAPRPPIILMNVSVAESRNQAHERAVTYIGDKWDSIDSYYHFSDGHLASEGLRVLRQDGEDLLEDAGRGVPPAATKFYVKIQVSGTPDDCLQQLAELQRLTGLDHLVTELAFGGMPHEEAELNMRLFVERAMPVLQRDPAFALPSKESPPASPPSPRATSEGIFTPA